jgi:hypothetical protein
VLIGQAGKKNALCIKKKTVVLLHVLFNYSSSVTYHLKWYNVRLVKVGKNGSSNQYSDASRLTPYLRSGRSAHVENLRKCELEYTYVQLCMCVHGSSVLIQTLNTLEPDRLQHDRPWYRPVIFFRHFRLIVFSFQPGKNSAMV